MDPAEPLQQQVDRGQVGDQHVGVHVEGLFGQLRGNQDQPLRPPPFVLARGP